MKTKIKRILTLLLTMLLLITMSVPVSAKTTDYSKLVTYNMTPKQIAKKLKLKLIYNLELDDAALYGINDRGDLDVLTQYNTKNKKAMWCISSDNSKASFCGIKTGITAAKADKVTKSKGWKNYRKETSQTGNMRIILKKGNYYLEYYSFDGKLSYVAYMTKKFGKSYYGYK